MKKLTFYSIIAILFCLSMLLFVAAIATNNQYEWLDTLVVISFAATLLSMPVLLLISYIFRKKAE